MNVINFSFEDSSVSILNIDGHLWWRASAITTILGFKNSRQALSTHVDPEDVQKLDSLTAGGKQKVIYINESGLYALIFGSTKPEAKKFKRWVTDEVLPSIRKTGEFSNNENINIEGYNELKELNQLIGNILDFRFLLTFDEQKKPHIRILSYDDLILPIEHIPRMINNRMSLSEELLLKIMQACTKRLTMMASCRQIEEKIKK